MQFELFTRELEASGMEVHGVEVYEEGILTHSWGDTEHTRYPIWSATKSFLSVAFGIAWDRGMISPEDLLAQYLPEDKLYRLNSSQQMQLQKLTLKRLLTMSVPGFPFRPEGENWLDFSLSSLPEKADTPAFEYSSIPTYLISAALTNAIGRDLYGFMNEMILCPLEIVDPPYQRSPEGIFYGASGMELTVGELSRLGLTVSAGGIYKGKRIVSEDYIRQATDVQQMNREGGYGFFFWKYRNGFSINGKWGQKCYCLPDRGLVITFMSHLEDGSDQVKAMMEKYLID